MQAFKARAAASLKNKDGITFVNEGEEVTITWIDEKPTVTVDQTGIQYRISNKGAAKLICNYIPTIEDMQEWDFDSGCETPAGEWVEPDGTDIYGAPSWLKVFGLI